MMTTPGHQAAIAGGLALTAESHEVPNHGVTTGFRIHRVGANRWDLLHTPQGWRIQRRTLRPLDGSEPARELLRHAIRTFAEA